MPKKAENDGKTKTITLGNHYHSLARQTSWSCYPICKLCNSHLIVRFSESKSWSIQSKCSQLVNNFLRMAGLVWESPGYQRFFWGLTMMIKVINRILMPINTLIKKTTPFQFFQLLAGPEKCLTTAGFFWEEVFAEKCKQESCGISVNLV